ncbi:beta-glucosidase [Brachybacterium huguangmaarense]|uniref:Beta-glucosidase n=1 Tax=Brachybacterium huguangmaarense TaxID=1652028 RepID=A0ABY6G4L7_9MICO|nr:glycoside hydrolase family 3 N-terminal domain-containing protein [Brachybacterium huguangmaarense]UYG18030.1 beta-glucosidase [Brachybacterium huguangmaarense]
MIARRVRDAGSASAWDADALGVLLASFEGPEVPAWLGAPLREGLGGVVLFGSNTPDPAACRDLARSLHAIAPDLLVAIDEEGGDVTRLQARTGSSLPTACALGRIDDVDLTRRVGRTLGDLLAACDVDLDLAPVLDVSTDPRNPVIGTRSFGDDPDLVSRHARALTSGLREAGVGACGKHFPGHGATHVDSHTALPRIDLPADELRREHLEPWALAPWLDAVMTGHLLVPALGEGPASISPWSRPLLDEVSGSGGYSGLVVTDALDMAAVAADPGPLEAPVRAIEAGAHLLCLGRAGSRDGQEMLREAHGAITGAVASGRLDREVLHRRAVEARRDVRFLRTRRTAVPAPSCEEALEGARRIGALAAARAVELRRAVLVGPRVSVVDARARPDHAAGPRPEVLVSELRSRGYDAAAAHDAHDVATADTALVLTRLPRADADEARALAAVLADRPDAIVVHTGVPGAAPDCERRVLALGGGPAMLGAAVDAMIRAGTR